MALHNQHVRYFACIGVRSMTYYKCLIQYEFVISPSCAVQIHNDGDADSICVNLMERCRVGDARIGRMCTGLVVCLNLKVL